MSHLYTIGLLVISNIFMTFAWYGHLKLQQIKVFSDNTPLYLIILCSWLLALPEYACRIRLPDIGRVFCIYEIKESFRAVALKGWLSGEKDKGTFI